MPRGREFCPFENDYFDVKEFKVVDGVRIHRSEPLHRATDGVLVKIENGDKVVPVNDENLSTPSERRMSE